MKIEINNEWIDYNHELYKNVEPRKGYFNHYYNNIRFNKYKTKIKFSCSSCNKEHIIFYENFNPEKILCERCKLESSCMDKYGVTNSMYSEISKNKLKQTMKEKYGVECLLSNQKWKEEKMQKKYGVNNAFQIPEVKETIHEKYQAKLKDEEYNKKVVDRRRKTVQERYGVNHVMDLKSVRDKQGDSLFKKYGAKHPAQVPELFRKQQIKIKSGLGIKIYYTKFGDKIHYQSKDELRFIQTCEEKDIKIFDGPTLKYLLNEKEHVYHCDFETNGFIIEIKATHQYYYEALESGEIDAKNKAAQEYAALINKEFLFLLDVKDYSNYI